MLACHGIALLDQFLGQRRRSRALGVGARDREGSALGGPVVVDLANHQLRGRRWGESPLEGSVVGDVELAIVEGRLAVGHFGVGVLAAQKLEADVGRGAASAGDDVLVTGLHAGAEVHRVGVVQAHLGEGPGATVQERMVAVVVERDVGAA